MVTFKAALHTKLDVLKILKSLFDLQCIGCVGGLQNTKTLNLFFRR